MHRLIRELPEKSFVAGPTGHCACNDCRFMKMNTIPKLLECLKDGRPSIEMDAELIEKPNFPSNECSSGVEFFDDFLSFLSVLMETESYLM